MAEEILEEPGDAVISSGTGRVLVRTPATTVGEGESLDGTLTVLGEGGGSGKEGPPGPPGPKGETGPKGEKGESGTGDLHFVFNEGVPKEVWTINHKLGKYPSVTVQDTAGDEVDGIVTYVSLEEIIITFSAPVTGDAYLN